MSARIVYPEDALVLLGVSLELESPPQYHERISALKRETHRRTKGAKLKLRGTTKTTATKSRLGEYELRYGLIATTFKFDKAKRVSAHSIDSLVSAIGAPSELLRTFFQIKKFSIDDTQRSE